MYLFSPRIICFLFFSIAALVGVKVDAIEMRVNDGPYVSQQGNKLIATWVCKNQQKNIIVPIQQASTFVEHCNLDATIFHQPVTRTSEVFDHVEKVAAISDFHGQYDLVFQILRSNGIIDKYNQWSFGEGHFVITGDVFDRGEKVTELLWFIYELEQQALASGGRVHFLLGNHEVMVLNGDLRYLHPKYQQVSKILNVPFESLFSSTTILGEWLRSKSVVVKVNDMLFAHGGFHPNLASSHTSLENINTVFSDTLVKSELASPRSAWANELHTSNGPIWYRGYFKGDIPTEDQLSQLLTHFAVNHIVVGHTSQTTIKSFHKNRVIAIDSSIKKGQYGEILIVNHNGTFRGLPDGKRIALFD